MKRNSSKPRLSRQIIDEASAWFVDFRTGDVDEHTRWRFDQWLRRSPEHIRAYIEIARAYAVLPTLDPERKVDIQQLIAYARSEGNVVPLGQGAAPHAMPGSRPLRRVCAIAGRDSSRRPPGRMWLAAACVVASILAGVLGWWNFYRFPTYATGLGEHRSITLADGSIVDLNARSEIRVELLKGRREVVLLAGQAFFQVAKDRTRPFYVQSEDLRVQAIGTQFDVDRKRTATTVTVIEGRVALLTPASHSGTTAAAINAEQYYPRLARAAHVDPSGASLSDSVTLLLTAGEQVVVTGTAVAKPRAVNVAVATAWLQHRFIFDRSSLSDVVDDFNRYNARPLVIVDRQLDDYHISGVYSSTDPASLIRFLRTQPGIKVTEMHDSVRIGRQ